MLFCGKKKIILCRFFPIYIRRYNIEEDTVGCVIYIYLSIRGSGTDSTEGENPLKLYCAGKTCLAYFCHPRSADQASTLPPPAEAAGDLGAEVAEPPPADGGRPRAGREAGKTGAVPK